MVAFLAMSLATSSAVMPFYQGGEGLSEGGPNKRAYTHRPRTFICTSLLAPALSSTSTTAAWPVRAAAINAVAPFYRSGGQR